MVGDYSRQMKTKILTAGMSAVAFAFYHHLNCWAPVPPSQISVQMSIFDPLSISRQIQYWENLGQTSSDYSMVGKK